MEIPSGTPVGSGTKKFHKKTPKQPNDKPPNAGVLLVELACDNGAGRCENAFMMLQSGGAVSRSGKPGQHGRIRKNREDLTRTYSDGGGKSEPGDESPAHTAAREMHQESTGLIAIPPEILATTLIIDIGFKYLCYVVATDTHIDHRLFARNRAMLKDAPQCWKEARALTKFYFSDLLTRTRADMALDIHGVECMLSTRAQHILTAVILMRTNATVNINIVTLQLSTATSPDFARGTSLYKSETTTTTDDETTEKNMTDV